MTFRGDLQRAIGDGRNHRKQVTCRCDSDFRGKIKHIAKTLETSVQVFVCASILHFDSLDRERQIELISQHSIGKGNPIWTITVHNEIKDHLENWSFPLHARTDVIRAAVVAFVELTEEERKGWIREVFIFVGDPRQCKSVPSKVVVEGSVQ